MIPECSEESYRCNFVDSMLRRFGGKQLKVIGGMVGYNHRNSYKMPDDGFIYDLGDLNTGESSGYSWTSSMFKNNNPLRRYPNLF